jgi:hypothetical protein
MTKAQRKQTKEREIITKTLATCSIITIGATDHSDSFADNTRRIVVKEETEQEIIGWPDPTDPHNSDCWKPGIDQPLVFPKFAWEG